MKSIVFFCLVFFSTLSAFLLATGEVQRWFSVATESTPFEFGTTPLNDPGDAGSDNVLYFPFYNVEQGRLSFVIRAQLSQEDLDVKENFDTIGHLTLRKGILEIPLQDGLELGPIEEATNPEADSDVEADTTTAANLPPTRNRQTPDETQDSEPGPAQVVLRFESADWKRLGKEDPNAMEVALKNGEGVTHDGFAFSFEDLLFYYKEQKGQDRFRVSSDKPVSVKNKSFQLRSPTGLRGNLKGTGNGLDSLTFLPPVTSIIDPQRAPFFQQPSGSNVTAQKRDRSDPGGTQVVITSDGPLSLQFAGEENDQSDHTVLTLKKNVVIRSSPAGQPMELSDEGSRFVCQQLELAFVERARRLVPHRALATWEGGKVKAFFHDPEDTKKGAYVLEGDRLEWNYRLPVSASVDKATLGVSEAILHGKPTLTGNGSSFQARQARLRLTEGRILLQDVDGWFLSEGKHEAPETFAGSKPDTGLGQGKDKERVRRFDLSSPEVEFFFVEDAGEQRLSHFLARSERPRGVVIESRANDEQGQSEAKVSDRPFRLTSSLLRYEHAEKIATFSGISGDRPLFVQQKNQIEATTMRLHLESETAVFEDGVVARVADLRGDEQKNNGSKKTSKSRQAAAFGDGPSAALGRSFELKARLLRAGFDSEISQLRYLHASGSNGKPVRVRSLSGPQLRLEGADLQWDHVGERAVVRGIPPNNNAPLPAPQPIAQLEFEGGKLRARQITYNGESNKVFLVDNVSLESDDGAKEIAFHCWRADVELFAKQPPKPVGPVGLLGELRQIKSIHAFRSTERPIELVGPPGADGTATMRGFADEAEWDADRLELRFFGDSEQEIHVDTEKLKGPVWAREIVFDERNNQFVLRGNVRGKLVQTLGSDKKGGSNEEASDQKASEEQRGKSARDESVVWSFETSRLEIQLRKNAQTKRQEVAEVRAREWVHLRNSQGLRLLGDNLTFDPISNRTRIFSPAGRPQTFFRDPESDPAAEARTTSGRTEGDQTARPSTGLRGGGTTRGDRIDAQEILILPYENPRARFGETVRWLHVQFDTDVKATFYPSSKRLKKSANSSKAWSMNADNLTLSIDPSQAPAQAVTTADTRGNVVFRSDEYTATGTRAHYRTRMDRVELFGNPARITVKDQTKEVSHVVFVKEGGQFKAEYKRDRSKPRR